MKVVYFIDHLRPDGTQQVLKHLVIGLARRDYQQTIVCINDSWDAQVVQDLRAVGADVRIIGKAALATGCGFLATWLWLRREQFQVAITFLFFADVLGRTLAHAAKVPRIISSLRARNVHYAFWQRFIVRQTMRWADVVVLNSAGLRNFAIGEEGVVQERIVVIPNGVCVEDYQNPISRAALRAELGLPSERIVIGAVGRLTYQKGFDLLLSALAQLPRQDVNLAIIGVGEDLARLQEQAAALHLERRVHFVGYRRDIPQLLGALDAYVHPARFEGMPNALLEAMAAGCPIVASAVDGNSELIEAGVHGWLVPPEDITALAEAITDALSDPVAAQCRGAAARQRAGEQFGVDMTVDMWEAVLAGKITRPGQGQ